MITLAAACLSLAMYHEARGTNEKTQRAVMSVVQNRGGHPCSVIREKGQFAFVKHGRIPVAKDKQSLAKMQKLAVNPRPNLSKKYKFFNEERLGVRFKTGVHPVHLGGLVFY